jgi:hypothetical protein
MLSLLLNNNRLRLLYNLILQLLFFLFNRNILLTRCLLSLDLFLFLLNVWWWIQCLNLILRVPYFLHELFGLDNLLKHVSSIWACNVGFSERGLCLFNNCALQETNGFYNVNSKLMLYLSSIGASLWLFLLKRHLNVKVKWVREWDSFQRVCPFSYHHARGYKENIYGLFYPVWLWLHHLGFFRYVSKWLLKLWFQLPIFELTWFRDLLICFLEIFRSLT